MSIYTLKVIYLVDTVVHSISLHAQKGIALLCILRVIKEFYCVLVHFCWPIRQS